MLANSMNDSRPQSDTSGRGFQCSSASVGLDEDDAMS